VLIGCGLSGCLGLLVVCLCCSGLATIREAADPYAEPGEEVASSSGGAGQPLVVHYTHEGATRGVYAAWLRSMGPDAALMRGSIACRFESPTSPGYHAASGATFPLASGSSFTGVEVSPGVVRLGSEHLRDGESFHCEGSIDEPYTYSGRLVITKQPLRPSDVFDL
jgi:hypothetical protein